LAEVIGDVVRESEQLKAACSRFADELAITETRRDRVTKVVRAAFALIGVFAMTATNMPALAELLGPDPVETVSLVSALALIVSAVGPLFISGDPPGRFHDYAHYIRGYCTRIDSITNHPQMTADEKKNALYAINQLAHENLNDVRNKWEWLAQRAERRLATDGASPRS